MLNTTIRQNPLELIPQLLLIELRLCRVFAGGSFLCAVASLCSTLSCALSFLIKCSSLSLLRETQPFLSLCRQESQAQRLPPRLLFFFFFCLSPCLCLLTLMREKLWRDAGPCEQVPELTAARGDKAFGRSGTRQRSESRAKFHHYFSTLGK